MSIYRLSTPHVRWVIPFILLSLLTSLSLTAQTPQHKASAGSVVDEAIWTVGDEPILKSEIENQKLYMRSQGMPLEGNPDCYLTEQLAVQMLFLNQAKIDSISVDNTKIDRFVDNFMESLVQQVGSRERLEEYFNRPYSSIREQQRTMAVNNEIVRQMQQKIIQGVTVTPSEIRSYYAQIPQDSLPYIPDAVKVQVLRITPEIELAAIDKIKEQLRGYSEDILAGRRDFSTIARLYSQDSRTSVRGGEYGFVARSSLEPEFAQVVFALSDTKQVSPIIRTATGYHIVQLIEKRDNTINFRHILLKPSIAPDKLQQAVSKADSVAVVVRNGKTTFDDAVVLCSNVTETKNNYGLLLNENYESDRYGTALFTMSELQQDYAAQVDKMQVGDVSPAFVSQDANGNTQVVLLKLKQRISGHRADMATDFQLVKQLALQDKKQKELDKWIVQHQKSTYIRISPDYQQCDFKYPGWIKK